MFILYMPATAHNVLCALPTNPRSRRGLHAAGNQLQTETTKHCSGPTERLGPLFILHTRTLKYPLKTGSVC
ncbi:hypothetical protein LDENG_00132040 [Lucifuga dentata]|nr:hypothetical protein LDENG_00132040 [Lucifuga dentata]